MNRHKKRLIALISLEIVLIILDNSGDHTGVISENWLTEVGLTYWVSIFLGVFIAIYAFLLSCNHCGARQVLRGISILDLSWPKDKCWKCKNIIEKYKYKIL